MQDTRPDLGKGTVSCPKCGKEQFRGYYMCLFGTCTQTLPGFEPEKHGGRHVTSNDTDLSKYTPQDVEEVATNNRLDEARVKRAGFDRYLQEINDLIKHAPTESDRSHYEGVKRNQVLPWYNKYHNTNYKS